MSYRIFRERLEKSLNGIGFPNCHDERVKAFSKIFRISKHTSASILNGTVIPKIDTLNLIAEELEVSPDWLIGNTDRKP